MANGQETRPRRVEPQPIAPVQQEPTTDPYLQLLQTGLSTPIQAPTNDPYAALETLLNNLQTRATQVQPQSKLQQIFQAIAQAAAVGASQDPGAALSQQLQGQQNRQFQQQQLQEQKLQRVEDIRLQFGVQRAQQQFQTQQEQSREERELQRLLKMKSVDRQAAIQDKLEERRYQEGYQTWLRDKDFEYQEKNFLNNLRLKKVYGTEIAQIEAANNKIVNETANEVARRNERDKYMITGIIPFAVADKITNKEFGNLKDNVITKEEQSYINRHHSEISKRLKQKHLADIRPPQTGGVGGSSFLNNLQKGLVGEFIGEINKTYVEVDEGDGRKRIVPFSDQSGIIDQVSNTIGGKKILRYLSKDENSESQIKNLGNVMRKYQFLLSGKGQPVDGVGGVVGLNVLTDSDIRAQLQQGVDNQRSQGFKNEQIIESLDRYVQDNPQNKPIVDQVKVHLLPQEISVGPTKQQILTDVFGSGKPHVFKPKTPSKEEQRRFTERQSEKERKRKEDEAFRKRAEELRLF